MRYYVLTIFSILLISCSGETEKGNDQDSDEPVGTGVEFDTYMQKISYCIGVDHARGCYQAYTADRVEDYFDIKSIEQGMIDYLAGNELKIQPNEKDSLLNLYLLDNGAVDPNVMSIQDAGYCVGMDEAYMLISQLVGRKIDQDVDVEYILIGVQEAFADLNEPTMQYHAAKMELQKYYADLNLENGKQFLNENALIEGVIETGTGLQYEIIQEGTGRTPNLTDSVVFHYTGRFIDGRVFDSTIPSKIPYKNAVINLIDGQQEAFQLMKEGGQYRLYIPPFLGYGKEPYGAIEPNSTLIFDVELIEVIRFKPS